MSISFPGNRFASLVVVNELWSHGLLLEIGRGWLPVDETQHANVELSRFRLDMISSRPDLKGERNNQWVGTVVEHPFVAGLPTRRIRRYLTRSDDVVDDRLCAVLAARAVFHSVAPSVVTRSTQ